jgi:hypothetical protein
MIIGANENTFLQRGSQFDVMRNVEGGIEDSGGRRGARRVRFGSSASPGSAPRASCPLAVRLRPPAPRSL